MPDGERTCSGLPRHTGRVGLRLRDRCLVPGARPPIAQNQIGPHDRRHHRFTKRMYDSTAHVVARIFAGVGILFTEQYRWAGFDGNPSNCERGMIHPDFERCDLEPETIRRRDRRGRQIACRLTAVARALAASLVLACGVADAERPALLVVSPQGTTNGWVDLGYLSDLDTLGFEVDYTDSLAEFTWDRLRRYNVLVIYTCPPDEGMDVWPFRKAPPISKDAYIALIDRFIAAGGGVFIMAAETQIRATLSRPIISRWGAELPLERIEDEANTAYMSRMPKVPLVYTNQVLASPVSTGVHGIWYPSKPHYNGAHTLPLMVDARWQVIVRAMSSAHTVPIDVDRAASPPPPDAPMRPGGVAAPPLFAIRSVGAGRVALTSQWPPYTIGAGTRWLYDREVLSTGLDGKRSDFGRLLYNTFKWLAAPSLESGALGGYRTPAERLLSPNLRHAVRDQYLEQAPVIDARTASTTTKSPTLFQGLIGAQTRLSGGQGTVADYADAARRAGLDFLVFLEDFDKLDERELAQLKADCAAHSDDSLTLYPGYRIDNNIGNHMFLFGPGVIAPPAQLLTGPHKKAFMLQGETAPGVFGPMPTWPIDFVFNVNRDTQIGYYDFAHSGQGMRMQDARLYGMAGVRTYRDGALIDDATDDYLTTVQGTLGPSPAAVNLVDSPAALSSAVRGHRGLTYAAAPSHAQLWLALGYTDQYTCPNVFTSDGPMIVRWPGCTRVQTYGGEPFVTGRSRMDAPLEVTADAGLREIRIFEGQNLFRRFKLNGEKRFELLLRLEGSVQHNLVLVAEDRAGNRTVSVARRSWKDGSLAPVFCNDRINDCGKMLLARGPYSLSVLRNPEVPDPGYTWDGGPGGILTPVDFEGSSPRLQTNSGLIKGEQYNQTPLLEFADEGAVVVTSVHDELIDPRVVALNPWRTFGPRVAAPDFDFALSYAQFERPSVGVPPVGWAAPAVHAGCNAALFRGEIGFKQSFAVRGLQLMRNWNWIASLPLRLVVGRRLRIVDEIDVGAMESVRHPGKPLKEKIRLGRGYWFGFYNPETGNSQLFLNRGRPLELRISRPPGEWVSLWAPVRHATRGEAYKYEIFSLACPIDAAAHHADDFVDALTYLDAPDGMSVTRGWKRNAAGPIVVRPDRYAVHLEVPRPAATTNLTLPVVIDSLNRRWSVGLWQISGFVKGDYGSGTDRYRAVGLDIAGRAYIPLYPDLAEHTEVEIGHPVVADSRGRDLFIQVTALSGGTQAFPDYRWHVEVNNPTDAPITTVLSQNMNLPGLQVPSSQVTLAAGEHRVLCCQGDESAALGPGGGAASVHTAARSTEG